METQDQTLAPRETRPDHEKRTNGDSRQTNGDGASHAAVSDHDALPENLPKFSKFTMLLLLAAIAVLLVVAFIARWIPDRAHEREIEQQANTLADAPPVVNVAHPQSEGAETDLILPGDARPMAQTAIYARVNGFLGRWLVDIGDHVEKGQLLATIDAPDTDAQLNDARAALLQAKANLQSADVNKQLADATYDRYHGLLASGSVTQQDLDTRKTNADQATATKAADEAAVKSAQAQVEQLEALQGFEKIPAPFSGTITFRNYDLGARISSSDTTAGHEMFDIADTDRLRVYVDVPQTYVTLIQITQPVDFYSSRNYGTKHFVGIVARTAGALDPSTRTLLTELDFENKDHTLWSGMYGQVHISVHQPHPILTVPTAAMLFESNGTQVAVVDSNNKVHFKKVTVGNDLGQRLEVVSGLAPDENVITNPGEKLLEGGEVQLAAQPTMPTRAPVAATDTPTTRVAQSNTDSPTSAH